MAELTPDRLQELRRIAEAATSGPWAWRMSKDGRILDLITLETGYNEELITPSHINAWLQVKGVKDFIPAFDPATALALLDEIERLRRERQVLAEVLKHVRTCDHCECALCPEGTGLSYRAYRALGGSQRAGSAS